MDTDRTSMVDSSLVLRDINSHADLRAVEAIQIEVWGLPELDVVPLTQLVAARASGGVVIGAFDGKELAGFVYGFCGYEDGRPTHHSHMLAVRAKYRGSDLGYRLKLAQREKVIAQGIDLMTWTFDPLQSLNAFLNFNKLGVISDRYLVNFYGEDAASFLHRNGTDRLWVTWELRSRHVQEHLGGSACDPDLGGVPVFLEVDAEDRPSHADSNGAQLPKNAVIEIPVNTSNIEAAASWRDATRAAFIEAFGRGYVVTGFYRGLRGERQVGRYSLTIGKE